MELIANFDAGTRQGNPGPSAIAIVFREKEKIIHQEAEFVGLRTSNEAEWLALIKALEICVEHAPALRQLALLSDSKLVVHQARGEWRTRGHLREFRQRGHDLAMKLIDRGCTCSIEHVPREQNAEADRLVTDLLDDFMGRKRGY